jgi:hypothetical protein
MIPAATRKQSVRYSFDALGRRVQRYVRGGSDNTKFIYDGPDIVMDDDANTGITKYQNGPGIDNKLTVRQGSTVDYFLADHLGSTNGLADSTGAITSQTSYDSFGNQTGTLATRYGFTGRGHDSLMLMDLEETVVAERKRILVVGASLGLAACFLTWLLGTGTSSPLQQYLLFNPWLRNFWGSLNFPVLAVAMILRLPDTSLIGYLLVFLQWFVLGSFGSLILGILLRMLRN